MLHDCYVCISNIYYVFMVDVELFFFNHLAFCVCNTLSTILTRICFNMFQMSRSGLFQNKDEIIKSQTRRGLSILSV